MVASGAFILQSVCGSFLLSKVWEVGSEHIISFTPRAVNPPNWQMVNSKQQIYNLT